MALPHLQTRWTRHPTEASQTQEGPRRTHRRLAREQQALLRQTWKTLQMPGRLRRWALRTQTLHHQTLLVHWSSSRSQKRMRELPGSRPPLLQTQTRRAARHFGEVVVGLRFQQLHFPGSCPSSQTRTALAKAQWRGPEQQAHQTPQARGRQTKTVSLPWALLLQRSRSRPHQLPQYC